MKRILLLGPACRNNGDFVDAGVTVDVGDAGVAITPTRAQELVDGAAAQIASDEQPKTGQRG